jgi:hypothetical protein
MCLPPCWIDPLQRGQRRVRVPVAGIKQRVIALPPEKSGHPVMDLAHQVVGVRYDDGVRFDGVSVSPTAAFLEIGHREQLAAPPTNQERHLIAFPDFHAVMWTRQDPTGAIPDDNPNQQRMPAYSQNSPPSESLQRQGDFGNGHSRTGSRRAGLVA